MAEFKTDLNPKQNTMGLNDLVKMSEYLGKGKTVAKPKPVPVYDKSAPWENTDLNTGKGDTDIPFKFGAGNNQE